jgi:hypothetical protein
VFAYRLLLIIDGAVAAISLIAFALWLEGAEYLFPDLIAWLVGLALVGGAIVAGVHYRHRDEMRAAHFSLALIAIPAAMIALFLIYLLWELSKIKY